MMLLLQIILSSLARAPQVNEISIPMQYLFVEGRAMSRFKQWQTSDRHRRELAAHGFSAFKGTKSPGYGLPGTLKSREFEL